MTLTVVDSASFTGTAYRSLRTGTLAACVCDRVGPCKTGNLAATCNLPLFYLAVQGFQSML